jgi:transcriptional regulator with XRE-family HTH domain
MTIEETEVSKRSKATNPRARPMSAAAFRAWRQQMGWSERDAAERLGMSRSGVRIAEARGAPLYVGLACAALAAELEPILTRSKD